MYTVKGTSITLTKGDTFVAQVEAYQNGEIYEPQEGDVVRFAMKRDLSDEQCLIYKNIPIDTMILRIESEDTKDIETSLCDNSFWYDIQITFANGDVDTFIAGILTLTEEVE